MKCFFKKSGGTTSPSTTPLIGQEGTTVSKPSTGATSPGTSGKLGCVLSVYEVHTVTKHVGCWVNHENYKNIKFFLDLPISSLRGNSIYCKHCYYICQVQQESLWEQPQEQSGATQLDNPALGPPALEAQQVWETLPRGLCWDLIQVM